MKTIKSFLTEGRVKYSNNDSEYPIILATLYSLFDFENLTCSTPSDNYYGEKEENWWVACDGYYNGIVDMLDAIYEDWVDDLLNALDGSVSMTAEQLAEYIDEHRHEFYTDLVKMRKRNLAIKRKLRKASVK